MTIGGKKERKKSTGNRNPSGMSSDRDMIVMGEEGREEEGGKVVNDDDPHGDLPPLIENPNLHGTP
jgi:hypothetical protein